MYAIEQLFTAHGFEYVVAATTFFVFIFIYYLLSTERKY
jgi:heme/copper-type cytochrome/quinol oxidase subunit 1